MPTASTPAVGRVSLPETGAVAVVGAGRRLLLAAAILVGTVLLVYFDREGYTTTTTRPGRGLTLLDSFYYTTVTLSTTGYGDIAPGVGRRPGWSTRSSSRPLASPSWCC